MPLCTVFLLLVGVFFFPGGQNKQKAGIGVGFSFLMKTSSIRVNPRLTFLVAYCSILNVTFGKLSAYEEQNLLLSFSWDSVCLTVSGGVGEAYVDGSRTGDGAGLPCQTH